MKLHDIKQWGVYAALLVLALVLETKAALFPIETLDGIAGLQHGAFSASCALLAIIFSSLAGGMKNDIRPQVRANATLARIVSIACLLVPISYLGSSFKHENQQNRWEAYTASPLYASDQTLVRDTGADIYDRRAAEQRLVQPTSAELSIFDFEFWMAAFFQIVIITAAGVKIMPPATEAEIKHYRAVQAGRKGAATRKARAAAKAKAKTTPPKLIQGGKK